MPAPSRPAGGRPTHLTVDHVVAAAVALLDADGLSGVSMRAVGRRTGLSPMGLYHYVASKDALLGLVLDHLLVPVAEAVLAETRADAALLAVADGIRATLARHPHAVPLLARPEPRPAVEDAARHCVALLAAEGAPPGDAFEMVRAVVAQVIGEAVTSHGGPGHLGVDLVVAGVRQRLAAVPRPAGPNADAASRGRPSGEAAPPR